MDDMERQLAAMALGELKDSPDGNGGGATATAESAAAAQQGAKDHGQDKDKSRGQDQQATNLGLLGHSPPAERGAAAAIPAAGYQTQGAMTTAVLMDPDMMMEDVPVDSAGGCADLGASAPVVEPPKPPAHSYNLRERKRAPGVGGGILPRGRGPHTRTSTTTTSKFRRQRCSGACGRGKNFPHHHYYRRLERLDQQFVTSPSNGTSPPSDHQAPTSAAGNLGSVLPYRRHRSSSPSLERGN